jgi:hypothetical protein
MVAADAEAASAAGVTAYAIEGRTAIVSKVSANRRRKTSSDRASTDCRRSAGVSGASVRPAEASSFSASAVASVTISTS